MANWKEWVKLSKRIGSYRIKISVFSYCSGNGMYIAH